LLHLATLGVDLRLQRDADGRTIGLGLELALQRLLEVVDDRARLANGRRALLLRPGVGQGAG